MRMKIILLWEQIKFTSAFSIPTKGQTDSTDFFPTIGE